MLVGRWGYYANGSGIGLDAENRISLSVTGTSGTQAEQFAKGLSNTAEALRSDETEVFILKAIPEIGGYESRKIARALAGHRMDEAGLSTAVVTTVSELSKRNGALDNSFEMMQTTGISLLDPAPYFCDEVECSALHDGKAQYFDNNHIINSAARRIRPLFAPIFELGPSE